MKKIIDLIMLAVCVLCIGAMIYIYTTKTDRYVFGDGCDIKIIGISGTLCQMQDTSGVYYTNGKIRVEVMK